MNKCVLCNGDGLKQEYKINRNVFELDNKIFVCCGWLNLFHSGFFCLLLFLLLIV